jgi:hypothetical protein
MTGLEPIGSMLPQPPVGSPDDAPLSETDELVLALVEVGVSVRKAEYLVGNFPAERIKRQLKWLPQRPARRPASLLIVAIERDYDAPAYS